MNYRRRITTVLCLTLVIALAGAMALLQPIDRERSHSTLQEVLYIPSPKILANMSLGYTGLVADIYWTRAVQYFGGRHRAGAQEYRLLAPLLDITTELDPRLMIAYRFGSIFLAQNPPEGAGQPEKAAELVERGIRANPGVWQLYYDLGFLQYMELHDPAAAARSFQRGSEIPGAHPFMKIMAATTAQHAGEVQLARLLWTTTYETTEDKMIRENARKHLRALRVDEDIAHLEDLLAQYRQRTGRDAGSWGDLVTAGMLPGIPVDPLGHPYRLVQGRVEVEDAKALPFIKKGLPPMKTGG